MNERKKQVLDDAKKLFIEKGFIATSVQDILTESQISKGTFYNYFTSKNECLIEILNIGQEETFIRRQELLIGHALSDKNTLADQITIRQQVNRDHNLFPIFEALFHSGDPELNSFAKKNHLAELRWLADRLIDIYGPNLKPYAADSAVIMIGMLHYMQARSMDATEKIDVLALVQYVIRRMDSIVPTMIETKDRFLEEGLLNLISDQTIPTKQQLHVQLMAFRDIINPEEHKNSLEYINFLLDEINATQPRTFLIETVLRSFREYFIETSYEQQVRKITTNFWLYLNKNL